MMCDHEDERELNLFFFELLIGLSSSSRAAAAFGDRTFGAAGTTLARLGTGEPAIVEIPVIARLRLLAEGAHKYLDERSHLRDAADDLLHLGYGGEDPVEPAHPVD